MIKLEERIIVKDIKYMSKMDFILHHIFHIIICGKDVCITLEFLLIFYVILL